MTPGTITRWLFFGFYISPHPHTTLLPQVKGHLELKAIHKIMSSQGPQFSGEEMGPRSLAVPSTQERESIQKSLMLSTAFKKREKCIRVRVSGIFNSVM